VNLRASILHPTLPGDGFDLGLQVHQGGDAATPAHAQCGFSLPNRPKPCKDREKPGSRSASQPLMRGLKHRFRAIAKEDQRQVQVRRINLARQGKQELLHLQARRARRAAGRCQERRGSSANRVKPENGASGREFPPHSQAIAWKNAVNQEASMQ
jgi:hypothetical protein